MTPLTFTAQRQLLIYSLNPAIHEHVAVVQVVFDHQHDEHHRHETDLKIWYLKLVRLRTLSANKFPKYKLGRNWQ